jgi:hypothetical protein
VLRDHSRLRRGDFYLCFLRSRLIHGIHSRVTSPMRPSQTVCSTHAKGDVKFQRKCDIPMTHSWFTLSVFRLPTGSDVEHDGHQCDAQYCPIFCHLCKRVCSSHNHLHALEPDAIHLCGYVITDPVVSSEKAKFLDSQEHPCPQRCTAPGVCEIDTAPHSIEATFEGMHECFHYTRVRH